MAQRGTEAARPQEQNPAQVASASKTADRGNGSTGKPSEKSTESTQRMTFSSDEIAARAYQIYERDGRADGRDMDHWLQAERELREERSRGDSAAISARPEQNRAEVSPRATSPARPPRADEAPRSARRHQAAP